VQLTQVVLNSVRATTDTAGQGLTSNMTCLCDLRCHPQVAPLGLHVIVSREVERFLSPQVILPCVLTTIWLRKPASSIDNALFLSLIPKCLTRREAMEIPLHAIPLICFSALSKRRRNILSINKFIISKQD
jgi:hypothetical protein